MLARQAGSRWGEADGLARRGHVLELLGRFDDAHLSWEAALTVYEQVDAPIAENVRSYLAGEGGGRPIRSLSLPAW